MKNRNNLKNILGCVILIMFIFTVMTTSNSFARTSFGDPFEGNTLKNANWNWQNEPPTWDLGETREGFLYINAETNRNIWTSDASHFLYQEIDVDMFDVETRFFARWSSDSIVNGLLVKSPADDNWVTIKFWGRGAGPQGHIQYQSKGSGLGPPDVQWSENFGEHANVDIALRLKKEDDTYTAWYKTAEDDDWVDIGEGVLSLDPPLWLGIYAGVADGVGTLEVEYEYFKDNLNPYPVEPGGKVTTTWGTVKTRY